MHIHVYCTVGNQSNTDEIVSLYNFAFTTKRYSSFTMDRLNMQKTTLRREFHSIVFTPLYEDATDRNNLSFVMENQGLKLTVHVGSLYTLS